MSHPRSLLYSKKGKNNFNRAITNVAKRFTETQVPLLEGIKLDVSKSRLT